MLKLLRPCALEPELCNKKPLQWLLETRRLETGPLSPQLEKSPHSSEDPGQPKINKTAIKKNKTEVIFEPLSTEGETEPAICT